MKTLMLIFACAYLIMSCSSDKTNEHSKETINEYPIINPAIIDTIYTKQYVAEIQSVQNVELRSKTKGIIEKIWVDEGKSVAAGQTIYSINNASLKIDLRKAEAQIKTILAEEKTLEIELENTKKLVEKGIVSISEQKMVEAKISANHAKIDEIKTDMESIRLQLSFSQITAPFSGTINRHLLKAGALVEEGTALTTISNNNYVYAYFNVSEREYLDFVTKKIANSNKTVGLILANNEPYPYKGTIETIEDEFDKNTGSIAFRARFANPNKVLKQGSSGKILLNQSAKGAIVIPQKATFEVQDKTYVFVVNDNNMVQQRSVIPIIRLDNLFVVEGILPQEKIIYEGIQTVKAGDKVTTKLVSFK